MRDRHMRAIGLTMVCVLGALLVPGTSSAEPAEEPGFGIAEGTVIDSDGRPVGNVVVFDDGETTVVDIDVEGLTPGRHGVQIHERGSCNAPYTSSGKALRDVELPAIQTAGTEGYAVLETVIPSIHLRDLFDDDDFSVIVHDLPDNAANIPARYGGPDSVTEATGDVGDGVACAVVENIEDEGIHTSRTRMRGHATEVRDRIRRRLGIADLRATFGDEEPATAGDVVRADLRDGRGRPIGTATLVPDTIGDGVQVVVQGLAPGVHGVQLHQAGSCTAPDFASTGAALAGSALPNVVVGPTGVGFFVVRADVPDVQAMLGGDGTSVVVHALADNATNVPARYRASSSPVSGPDDVSLATGDVGAAVGCGVLRSVPRVERYLETLYDVLLGRQPSKAAVDRWSAHLQRGGSRLSMVHSLASSNEGIEYMVTQIYNTYGLSPTDAEMRYWVTYLRDPASEIDVVIAHVLASADFFDQFEGDTSSYVYVVYLEIFSGDEDEPDEHQVELVADWLDAGGSRLALATWLMHTDRYRVSIVTGLLGFDEDFTLADVAKWLRHMRRGGDWRPLYEQVLASDDFYRYSGDASLAIGLGFSLFDQLS